MVHYEVMANNQVVPDKTQLKRYVSQGLTQQQIVEAWEADSGLRVSRSAIAMAMERYDLTSPRAKRHYKELLPWVVALEHRPHNDARMLRLEGRRRAGLKLSDAEARWLEGWKDELKQKNAVIHYERDTQEGFFWVPRDEAQTNGEDDLIDRSNAPLGSGHGGQSPRPKRAARQRD